MLDASASWTDCGAFVAEVLRREFGLRVDLPPAAESPSSRDRQIGALVRELARPTATPTDGDGVLMRLVGRRGTVGHHIGLWASPGYVLHYLPRGPGGVRLQDLAGMRPVYQVEGFYQWLA